MIHTLPIHQFSLENLRTNDLETLSIQTLNYLSTLNNQTNLPESLLLVNAKIQLGKLMVESESNPSNKGRGGNNIA